MKIIHSIYENNLQQHENNQNLTSMSQRPVTCRGDPQINAELWVQEKVVYFVWLHGNCVLNFVIFS